METSRKFAEVEKPEWPDELPGSSEKESDDDTRIEDNSLDAGSSTSDSIKLLPATGPRGNRFKYPPQLKFSHRPALSASPPPKLVKSASIDEI